MRRIVTINKTVLLGFFAALILTTAVPAFAAKMAASKTSEQEILEEKKDLEQAVTADESVRSPLEVAVENLPEDGSADHPAGEVAGEVDPARRAAVGGRGATDEARGGRLREERSDADQHHAAEDRSQAGNEQQR